MTSFLHGSETIEVKKGPVPVTVVKAAVIGLVGIAPKGPVNVPTLVLSDSDAAQFGQLLPGFNIPKALAAILAHGAGTIIVVNVFDPATMTTAVAAEAHVVSAGKFKLTFPPISNLVITNTAGDVTYTLGEDYTVDDFGNVTVMGTDLIEGGNVKASYKKLDSAAVEASHLVGSVDADTGARTGMKCFDLCYNLFGFNARIFIAPGYSTLSAVAAGMAIYSEKFRGFHLIDAPLATTVTAAIAGRGPTGAINFNTSNRRAGLMYPMLRAYDPSSNADENQPYSQFFAGLWASVIANEGFHVSPSNHEIKGITGVERGLTASIDDPESETNLLNAAGIITVFNSFGTGMRAWGNRSAAFPSSTSTRDVFLAVLMTASVIDESIRYAMLQFLDKPADQAWVDSIVESVNLFMRTLVGRGALIDGVCFFDPTKNTVTEMGAGHFVFSYSFASPVPGERLTFESFYDINLLKSLK